jgi:hypothetical protein
LELTNSATSENALPTNPNGTTLRQVIDSLLVRGWTTLRRFAWALASLTCLILSYLLVWQRGFYFDDYNNRILAYNVITGHTSPIWDRSRYGSFPARMFAWTLVTGFAQFLTSAEFWVRLVAMLGIGFNALLLGWFVYRVLGSRLAALISGWLFLVPVYGFEAILWLGAIGYIFMVTLALLFLHACWSAFADLHRIRHWRLKTDLGPVSRSILLSVLAFVTMLLIAESYVTIIGLVPLLGVVFAMRRSHTRMWVMLRRAIFIAAWPSAISAIIYFLFYRASAIEAQRGGLDLSYSGLSYRVHGYFDRLRWMTVSDKGGEHLTDDVFRLGRTMVFASWKGTTLFVVACVLILLTALSWRTDERDYKARYCVGSLLVAIGLIWAIVTMLFPAVLAKAQILEYRMLYFPIAGLSVALGTFIWMVMKWIGRFRPAGEKICIAVVGVFLLMSTIPMVGYTYAFAARSRLDQQQIAAVTRAIPAEYLPQHSYIVPFALEEHLPVRGDYVNALLVGVFDAPHSANAALEMAYRRNDLISITSNHWVGMKFSDPSGQLTIQGFPMPTDRTVLFTLRGNTALVIEQITINEVDGTQRVVQFPVARALHQRGTATISNIVVTDNVATYTVPPSAP